MSSSVVAREAVDRSVPGSARPPRARRLRARAVLHWLHVYTSMASLLVVLFFAATGVTLNHPDWLAGESTTERAGRLPPAWRSAGGVDWMVVDEYLRAHDGVHGAAADRRADARQGSLTFRAPGYAADCTIAMTDGSYRLTVSSQGFVGVLNDLHRGRDAGRAWGWVLDVSGVLLAVISLTGLGLLWYLKKVRGSAFLAIAAGGALALALMRLAAR